MGANFVLCTECNIRYHHQCAGLRNLRGVQNFVCPSCAKEGDGGGDYGNNEVPELVVCKWRCARGSRRTVLLLGRCAGL